MAAGGKGKPPIRYSWPRASRDWPPEKSMSGIAAGWIQISRLRLNMEGRHCLRPGGFGGRFGFGIKPARQVIIVSQSILGPAWLQTNGPPVTFGMEPQT